MRIYSLYSMWVECTGHSWFEYFYTGKCLSKKYRVNTISYPNVMSKFTQSVNLLKVRTKQFPQYSKLVSKLTTILFRWVNSVSEEKLYSQIAGQIARDQRSARKLLMWSTDWKQGKSISHGCRSWSGTLGTLFQVLIPE